MHFYAVFLRPRPASAPVVEEAGFVRQGFNWSAFLVTPLWALAHGYWLALALCLAWILVVGLVSSFANLDGGASLALYAFGALTFGLEADRFREARLSQKGFLLHGLTLGESLDEAESLYFGRLLAAPQPASPSSGAQSAPISKSGGNRPNMAVEADLLGLFPPQETQR